MSPSLDDLRALRDVSLDPEPTDRMESLRERRRRSQQHRALAAAAAVVVLAGAGASAVVLHHSPSPGAGVATLSSGPSGSASPSTTTSATPTAAAWLPKGKTGTSADVPWTFVGADWEVALVAGHGADTIVLVDPSGGAYDVGSVSSSTASQPTLLAWSGDGRRVLTGAPMTNIPDPSPYGTLAVHDLVTGTSTPVTLPGGAQSASFTRPTGKALLVATTAGTIERLDLTGSVQAVLASGISSPSMGSPSPLSSPDGTQVVFGTSAGLSVLSNAGGTPTTIGVPAGCRPLSFASATVVLASCGDTVSTATPVPDPLRWVDIVTGSVAPVSASHVATGPDYGDIDALQLNGVTYTTALGACGSIGVLRVSANGTAVPVDSRLPGPRHFLLGTRGSELVVAAGPEPVGSLSGCDDTMGVYLLDPISGHSQALWTGGIEVLSWTGRLGQ